MTTGFKNMDRKTKDFVFSFVLAALGIYFSIEGFALYKKVAGPPYRIERFSLSPGFLPFVLGILLVFFSILLFVTTMKGEKSFGASFAGRWKEFGKWFADASRNKEYYFTIGAVVIMFIYSYLLLSILPFWAASLIFLVAIFLYLKAGVWWKSIIVAVGAVVLTVVVFKYCFNAALP